MRGFRIRKEYLSVIIWFITYLVITMILLISLTPKQYNLIAGQISPYTITAPRQVVDQYTTNQLKDDVAKKVAPVYKRDTKVTQQIKTGVTQSFASAILAYSEMRNEVQMLQFNTGTTKSFGDLPDAYINNLSASLPFKPAKEILGAIYHSSPTRLAAMQSIAEATVDDQLNDGISNSDTAYKDITLVLLDKSSLSKTERTVTAAIIKPNLKADLFLDQIATDTAIQAARDAVKPIEYLKGEKIIGQSEKVYQNQIEVLKALGLHSSKPFDLTLTFGIAAFTFLLMALTLAYITYNERTFISKPKYILLYACILTINILLGVMLKTFNSFLPQSVFAVMMVVLLMRHRLALITNIVASILVSLLGNTSLFSVETLIVSLTAGMVVVFMHGKSIQRSTILITGIFAGAIAGLTAGTLSLIGSTLTYREIILNSMWALVGGILSAILCLGTLTIWENVFGILTPIKLLELSNQNHPLLKRLAMEAPATHHHSLVVAILAERAAEAIGANALLVRAAAYYHDVGKLENPSYFTENQLDKNNPHDRVSPRDSARILTAHTIQGLKLVKKYKLPAEICDIVVQHHGTMEASYFYQMAQSMGLNPDSADYFYRGPKPRTKEAALIMLADCVEATIRALPEKDSETIYKKIRELIKVRIDEGQFDECDLTMRDFELIAREFTSSCSGILHERIAYPVFENTATPQENSDEHQH